MDPRFTVTAQPRPLPAGLTAETPPISLAWRAMEAWHRELKASQHTVETAVHSARTAWIALVDEYYRLRRLTTTLATVLDQVDHAREAEALQLMLRRLERVLQEQRVQCAAPVGEAYTVELSDYLLNIDQKVSPEVSEPTVFDVVEPIVLQEGEVIRVGKAIIAVPASAGMR
ncbi:MAG: hypothetical protein HYZ50_20175 [Deltaproteobacteria bacterium]|nr:hypothetical protein [Deltaproteobacteria bacterium]